MGEPSTRQSEAANDEHRTHHFSGLRLLLQSAPSKPHEHREAERDDDALASPHTPVSLDLGGGSPCQIAHSIVGEVLAGSNDRDPQHRRERDGPIHECVDVESDAPVQ
ncbi:MAG: hypothetical protein ABEI27_05090 [Halobellus sp.]|uniref:hypothetical protein n=1 Tax=Halobellus sp. TaxID=1979212 RepID=UPI0035D4EED7